ncbi:MAG: hypothetical protein IJ109_09835 [Firmicutes bacterium]|nr:hypothetical protein [Bacillota bacterium]MBQ9059523.1 hypothetical protein [Bacillota bacterium]
MKKKILSMVLSAAVLVTMCFGTTTAVFAGEKEAPQFTKTGESIITESAATTESVEINGGVLELQNATDASKVLADAAIPVIPLNGMLDEIPKATNQVKINIPSPGYLRITFVGYSEYSSGTSYYGADVRTTGYSRDLYFNKDNERWIAVKKGTYTFTVNPIGDKYAVFNKFFSVKEAKYGKKQKKAKTIKRKSIRMD